MFANFGSQDANYLYDLGRMLRGAELKQKRSSAMIGMLVAQHKSTHTLAKFQEVCLIAYKFFTLSTGLQFNALVESWTIDRIKTEITQWENLNSSSQSVAKESSVSK